MKNFEGNLEVGREDNPELEKSKNVLLSEIPNFETVENILPTKEIVQNSMGINFYNSQIGLDIPGWPPNIEDNEKKLSEFLGITESREVIIPPSWGRGGIISLGDKDIVLTGIYLDPQFKKDQLGSEFFEDIELNVARFDKENYGKLKFNSALMDWQNMTEMQQCGYKRPDPLTIFQTGKQSFNPDVIYVRLMNNGVRISDLGILNRLGDKKARDQLIEYSIKKLPKELKITNKEDYFQYVNNELVEELNKRHQDGFLSFEVGVLEKDSNLVLDSHNITLAGEIVDSDHSEFIKKENEYDPYVRKQQASQYACFLGNITYFGDGLGLDRANVQNSFNISLVEQEGSYDYFNQQRINEIVDLLKNINVVTGFKPHYSTSEAGREMFNPTIEWWKKYQEKLIDFKNIEQAMEKELKQIFIHIKKENVLLKQQNFQEIKESLGVDAVKLNQYLPEVVSEILEKIITFSTWEDFSKFAKNNYRKVLFRKIVLDK